MTLFLIAHKVRGEPAFDVAEQIECVECNTLQHSNNCFECKGAGHWWIIPTSGHRAHPYWTMALDECPPVPEDWPDHYESSPSRGPARPEALADLLALLPKPPSQPMKRRF